MNAVRQSVQDFKNSTQSYAIRIHEDQAVQVVLEGFKAVKNFDQFKSFVEIFSSADRHTRLMILTEMIDVVFVGTEVEVRLKVLKGTESRQPILTDGSPYENFLADHLIEGVVSKGLFYFQELAYFGTGTSGFLLKVKNENNEVTDGDAVIATAYRILTKYRYDLSESAVLNARDVLIESPYVDRQVDRSMIRLLKSGIRTAAERQKMFAKSTIQIYYNADHELQMLARNARGLSRFQLDFKNASQLLANETDYQSYFISLVDFHKKHDLRKYPELLKLVVTYFNTFTPTFRLFSENVEQFLLDFPKFKSDLGVEGKVILLD